ncbi:MAG: hypothetical protein JEZ07_04930 [Phycisphaerae bacterium]|nr:hypothetical protein [Phycisphaerae bacterium]
MNKLSILYVFCMLFLALGCEDSSPQQEVVCLDKKSCCVYVVLTEQGDLEIEYEGYGMLNRRVAGSDTKKKNFSFSYVQMVEMYGEPGVFTPHVENPDDNILDLQGKLKIRDENQVSVTVTLESKINGRIQFCKMKSDKFPDTEFPEIEFNPETKKIEFQGEITGWLIE